MPTAPTWVFPFDRPLPPGDGDNQALAVNTEDGSVAYDVSFSLVWADGDDDVLNRNEAYAAASCRDCRTVAVAFQVVLMVGSVDVVVPQNLSTAVNYACLECVTYALATQLVVTVPGPLGDARSRASSRRSGRTCRRSGSRSRACRWPSCGTGSPSSRRGSSTSSARTSRQTPEERRRASTETSGAPDGGESSGTSALAQRGLGARRPAARRGRRPPPTTSGATSAAATSEPPAEPTAAAGAAEPTDAASPSG